MWNLLPPALGLTLNAAPQLKIVHERYLAHLEDIFYQKLYSNRDRFQAMANISINNNGNTQGQGQGQMSMPDVGQGQKPSIPVDAQKKPTPTTMQGTPPAMLPNFLKGNPGQVFAWVKQKEDNVRAKFREWPRSAPLTIQTFPLLLHIRATTPLFVNLRLR